MSQLEHNTFYEITWVEDYPNKKWAVGDIVFVCISGQLSRKEATNLRTATWHDKNHEGKAFFRKLQLGESFTVTI